VREPEQRESRGASTVEEATAQTDPSHTNAEAVFADGSRLWWNGALQAWETGPAATQGRVGEIRGVRPLL
jgi:hypothetical protein